MCFSASASFTAATVLTVIGALTVNRTTEKRQLFFALIPLIFALQQFAEGAIWLDPSQQIAKTVFLFIALVVWPIWIPLALQVIEKNSLRRNVLYFLFLLGIVYSLLVFNEYRRTGGESSVSIIGHNIAYQLPSAQNYFYYALYLAATLIPPFISSLRYIWVFALLNVIGLLIAQYLFAPAFISVWCFFAAVISISIYFVLEKNFQRKNSIENKG